MKVDLILPQIPRHPQNYTHLAQFATESVFCVRAMAMS